MAKQVIHLFGAAGSGTTTLGRFLSGKLGYHHMDTDDYFWEATDPPYTVKRPRSERLALMLRDIQAHENIIISGSLIDWGDELIPLFTLAVRMETDTALRIERLKKREREKLGPRIDPGGDMHEHHLEFLDWAASYDSGGPDMRSRASHDRWQKLLKCPLIILNGNTALEDNSDSVKRQLSAAGR